MEHVLWKLLSLLQPVAELEHISIRRVSAEDVTDLVKIVQGQEEKCVSAVTNLLDSNTRMEDVDARLELTRMMKVNALHVKNLDVPSVQDQDSTTVSNVSIQEILS